MTKPAERIAAFVFGVVFVSVILAIALSLPEPSNFQYTVFRIVLALAAAGVAAMIPGFIAVEVNTVVRAGGAIAVFVIVYFSSPAELVRKAKQTGAPKELKPIVAGEALGPCQAEYHASPVQLFERGWMIANADRHVFIAVTLDPEQNVRWSKITDSYIKERETPALGIDGENLLRLGFRWWYLGPNSQRVREMLGKPSSEDTRAWIQYQPWEKGLLVYGLPTRGFGPEKGFFQELTGAFLANFEQADRGIGRYAKISEGSVDGEVYCSCLWYPTDKRRLLPQTIVDAISTGRCHEARGPDLFTREHDKCYIY